MEKTNHSRKPTAQCFFQTKNWRWEKYQTNQLGSRIQAAKQEQCLHTKHSKPRSCSLWNLKVKLVQREIKQICWLMRLHSWRLWPTPFLAEGTLGERRLNPVYCTSPNVNVLGVVVYTWRASWGWSFLWPCMTSISPLLPGTISCLLYCFTFKQSLVQNKKLGLQRTASMGTTPGNRRLGMARTKMTVRDHGEKDRFSSCNFLDLAVVAAWDLGLFWQTFLQFSTLLTASASANARFSWEHTAWP